MNLRQVTENLIKFRTETGNKEEIERCMNYVCSLFGDSVNKLVHKKEQLAPVLLLRNCADFDLDVLVVGHIDVVPAEDEMFVPRMSNGRLYGRGSLDMKSFAAVGLESLQYAVEQKLALKFGVLLSSDEEKGSFGLESFLEDYPQLTSKIVLDVDVGGDVTKIVTKCKNPVFVKLVAQGCEAHGSTPWSGIDANEKIVQVWNNIRRIYPYFSKELPLPQNTWIDTVHLAKIAGGEVINVIANCCEAWLDFRLTEQSTLGDLQKNLEECLISGVTYEILSASHPVVMDENNPYILRYKQLSESILNQKVQFEYIGGATDSRAFAAKGATVIMHSGSGEGMHAAGEYVIWSTVEQLAQIQKQFLAELKI